jgi:hypothetical protein
MAFYRSNYASCKTQDIVQIKNTTSLYKASVGNENVYIKFTAHDTFLE